MPLTSKLAASWSALKVLVGTVIHGTLASAALACRKLLAPLARSLATGPIASFDSALNSIAHASEGHGL